MERTTRQMDEWDGQFGRDYTDRNALTLDEMERMYHTRYGLTRTEMNSSFIGNLDRDMRILEVGSNIGNQLLCLKKAGFGHLYGIELQPYAVELSKSRTQGINIIQGSAFDIPFKDCFFNLVLTSGVLIHISPTDIGTAIDEIYRCARRFVWGFEYYAEEYTEIRYRGHDNILWKANFSGVYRERHKDLVLIKEKLYRYTADENVDAMFVLEKVAPV